MTGIALDNPLRRIDLNLLVTLDALLAEHSVTRAAERLHLAQPTVSVQLARLRQIFSDPLLLPGPRGMRPTARADALRAPLQQALAGLAQAIAPPAPFDPARARQVWRIAASDYGAITIIQPMLDTLRKQAPGIRLALVNLDPPALARQAEQGDIDLVFHIPDDSPPGLRSRAMLTEHYVLAGRRNHPHLKRRPTLARFCRLEHAIVSPDGGGFLGMTDRVLHRQGLSRNVVLSVPHFGTLLSVLASTDLVAMVPSLLVQNHAALRIQPAPLDIPGFDMHMLWPERLHRDAAHQWLRDMITQEGASSMPPGRSAHHP